MYILLAETKDKSNIKITETTDQSKIKIIDIKNVSIDVEKGNQNEEKWSDYIINLKNSYSVLDYWIFLGSSFILSSFLMVTYSMIRHCSSTGVGAVPGINKYRIISFIVFLVLLSIIPVIYILVNKLTFKSYFKILLIILALTFLIFILIVINMEITGLLSKMYR